MSKIYYIQSSILWSCPYGEIHSTTCLWSRLKTDNLQEVVNCANKMSDKIDELEPRGHSPQQFIALIESDKDNKTTFQKLFFEESFRDLMVADLESNNESEIIESKLLYEFESYRDDLKKPKKWKNYHKK